MHRHAYLVMVHTQPELMKMLLTCLDHPAHDFYIHIDQKVKDVSAFQITLKHSSVYYTRRVNVRWGGYSQVRTELTLLKTAALEGYDYYHLLSGADLPLRSAQEIYNFFEENLNREYIHYCTPAFSSGESVAARVRYYHILQEIVGRDTNMLGRLNRLMLKAQKVLGIDRLRHSDLPVCCGANWFSITGELAQYLLSQEKKIQKTYRYGFCVDELMLQSIVYSSPFKNRVYMPNENGDYRSCLRYIDWERGNPYVFRSEDFEDLITSDFLFARKFDLNTDRSICERIVEYVMDGKRQYVQSNTGS